MNTSTNIISNSHHQRFLILAKQFDADNIDTIDETSFDAIWFDTEVANWVEHSVSKIRKSVNGHIYLKPVFAKTDLKVYFAKIGDLIDGYADSIENQDIIEITENILRRKKNYAPVSISNHFRSIGIITMQILRYYYSRGNGMKSIALAGSQTGYTRPFSALFYEKEHEQVSFMIDALQKCSSLGYLKANVLDKVHLCPTCQHSHLNFRETCPKCKSTNLQSDTMIHHFVCANISPESDYIYGDYYRCPKCRRVLRHMGVDYDKPSDVFKCTDCRTTFLYPEMRVLCFNCESECDVEDLAPVNIYNYDFTQDTLSLVNYPNMDFIDIGGNIFPGYISFSEFEKFIKSSIYLVNERVSESQEFSVVSIQVLLSEVAPDIEFVQIRQTMKNLSSIFGKHIGTGSMLSFKTDTFFSFHNKTSSLEESDLLKIKVEYEEEIFLKFNETLKASVKIKQSFCHVGDTSEEFIKNIQIF